MKKMSFTEARDGFATTTSEVIEHSDPILITQPGVGSVVVVVKQEFCSMEETLHLFSTSANAERLLKALDDYERGGSDARD